MARLMLSAGMFSALAAAIAPRNRGLPSGSPPPPLAAMVISLIRRVKILPRLASSAPFLCLIVAHFEWPDMLQTSAALKSPLHRKQAVNHSLSCTFVVENCSTQRAYSSPGPPLQSPALSGAGCWKLQESAAFW